ncbi:hypothetical protein NECAME_14126 [Necator americanus]|uniref:Uncharacterized protein n=1 Tax=Necator americanus TaxID=51031 RepID=W2SPY2_NECAM|nr:hypothetical protein NECAME_14126 [Necator americanus]ETN71700.1 hypothetical protein NECAME_14126 [Necator americanus]
MTPTVVLDTDQSVSDISDDGNDEEENIWEDSAQKQNRWTLSEPMSCFPFYNQRSYWSPKPWNLARSGYSIAGDFMTRDRIEEIERQ